MRLIIGLTDDIAMVDCYLLTRITVSNNETINIICSCCVNKIDL